MKNSILRLTLTLFLITAVVAAALAGINAITAPKIAALNAQKTTDAIAAVLPNADNAEKIYTAPNADDAVQAVYCANGAYAVNVITSGFGGDIVMMVGVDSDGKVLGVDIISHTETAGLGDVAAAQNAKGNAFRQQFVGQSGVLAVTKDGGAIEAITSATITSRGVTGGINTALEFVQNMDKEAGK